MKTKNLASIPAAIIFAISACAAENAPVTPLDHFWYDVETGKIQANEYDILNLEQDGRALKIFSQSEIAESSPFLAPKFYTEIISVVDNLKNGEGLLRDSDGNVLGTMDLDFDRLMQLGVSYTNAEIFLLEDPGLYDMKGALASTTPYPELGITRSIINIPMLNEFSSDRNRFYNSHGLDIEDPLLRTQYEILMSLTTETCQSIRPTISTESEDFDQLKQLTEVMCNSFPLGGLWASQNRTFQEFDIIQKNSFIIYGDAFLPFVQINEATYQALGEAFQAALCNSPC